MWNHGGALWAQFQRPHSVEEYCKTQIFKIKKKERKKNKRSARPCRSHWLQHPDLGEADVTRELSILPKIDKEKKTQPHLWTHDNRSATFASWLYRVHSLRSQAPCFCFFSYSVLWSGDICEKWSRVRGTSCCCGCWCAPARRRR